MLSLHPYLSLIWRTLLMVCVSYTDPDYQSCLNAVKEDSFAEIRMDTMTLNSQQVTTIFSLPCKLIATFRPCEKYDEKQRLEFLKTAIQSGAAYVDVEIEAPDTYRKELIKFAQLHKTQVIISYHHFTETPALQDLHEITDRCFKYGADIAKIVTTINNKQDIANVMALYSTYKNIVAFGMGEQGKISRVLAPLLGASYTYAAPDNGNAAAPGQIPRHTMEKYISLLRNI
jgi:3-dehydroquinate dehydratase I